MTTGLDLFQHLTFRQETLRHRHFITGTFRHRDFSAMWTFWHMDILSPWTCWHRDFWAPEYFNRGTLRHGDITALENFGTRIFCHMDERTFWHWEILAPCKAIWTFWHLLCRNVNFAEISMCRNSWLQQKTSNLLVLTVAKMLILNWLGRTFSM